ncbi:MAG: HEAT repeat domain-containing protein [Planctomycetes bacterium]|nr:HEAT repeat domain-containing protein [Planctomycetota bacterium]
MAGVDQLQKHLRALNDGDDAAQRAAIHAFRALEVEEWGAAPQSLVNPLVVSLQRFLRGGSRPPVVYKEVGGILVNLGPRAKGAVGPLIELLEDGIPDSVRESAARALGSLGRDAKDAVDSLVALCTNQSTLALNAVRALGEIGCADQRVRNALVKVWLGWVHTRDDLLQVAHALCRLRIEMNGMIGFLTNHLMKSQAEALRKSAAEALAWCKKTDTDVVPALLTAALSDKNEDVRQTAQAALDHLGLTQAKAILLCAKQLSTSVYAEAALRKSGQPAIAALIEALGCDDSVTRIKAAQILGSFGELAIDAVPVLTSALRDRNPEIRLATAKGLWSVTKNPDVAVPVLAQLLQDEPATGPDDDETRRKFLQTVIEALWRIGPPASAALPAIIRKTKDKNRLVSQSAHNALKKIAPLG